MGLYILHRNESGDCHAEQCAGHPLSARWWWDEHSTGSRLKRDGIPAKSASADLSCLRSREMVCVCGGRSDVPDHATLSASNLTLASPLYHHHHHYNQQPTTNNQQRPPPTLKPTTDPLRNPLSIFSYLTFPSIQEGLHQHRRFIFQIYHISAQISAALLVGKESS